MNKANQDPDFSEDVSLCLKAIKEAKGGNAYCFVELGKCVHEYFETGINDKAVEAAK